MGMILNPLTDPKKGKKDILRSRLFCKRAVPSLRSAMAG